MDDPAAKAFREPAPLAIFASSKSYVWFVVGTVCIGAFMGQADASITQVVLPALEKHFEAPISHVSWVALAYLLALASLLPIVGRLADTMGRKLLYTAGFLLFIFGSALCGFAPTLELLIAARVLQAIGACLLQANSVAIIVAAAGDARRGRALGIQAAAQAIGLCAGPALGGLLISYLSWRWVFWINVPFGLIGAVLGWLVLPQSRMSQNSKMRFDWLGALLLTPTITAVIVALNLGGSWGFQSPWLIGTLTVASILIVSFIAVEMRRADALVDVNLFRNRAFSAGNVAGLLSYALLFGMFFLMPFAFERGYNMTSLESGLRLAVIPLVLASVAPISGRIADRIGPRWPTLLGMAAICAGFLFLRQYLNGERLDLWVVTLGLGIVGFGQGMFIAPNNSAIMSAAPLAETGQAGGVLNVVRSIGTSVGVALATSVLSWQLSRLTGRAGDTLHSPAGDLLAAARMVIWFFVGGTILAAFATLIGTSATSSPSTVGLATNNTSDSQS